MLPLDHYDGWQGGSKVSESPMLTGPWRLFLVSVLVAAFCYWSETIAGVLRWLYN